MEPEAHLVVAAVVFAILPLVVRTILLVSQKRRLLSGDNAEPSPYHELQHPTTEEMREIYRQLDTDLGIADPDLLTPEKMLSEPQKKMLKVLTPQQATEIRLVWVNVLYTRKPHTELFREAPWPRIEAYAAKSGDLQLHFDIIDPIEFPEWKFGTAWAVMAVFDSANKDKVWIARAGDIKTVQNGDKLIINAIGKEPVPLGVFPAGEKRMPAHEALTEMRKLQELKRIADMQSDEIEHLRKNLEDERSKFARNIDYIKEQEKQKWTH